MPPRHDISAETREAAVVADNDVASAHRDAPSIRALKRPDRTLDAPPPLPLTSLIGREREIAEVVALLTSSEARLVTLTGAGGIGKTRLAVEIALRLRPTFADGVAFVSLADVSDPALVLPTVAMTIGAAEAPDRSPLANLRTALAEAELLLVLDNFEQVNAAAPEIAGLLSACQGVRVLVTSRGALHVSGEQEVPVPPLAIATLGRKATPQTASALPAVRLFVERAQAVRRDFSLTEGNVAAVVEICRRVDGLPLAIELAASRSRVLPPTALLARLERRLPLLTGGHTHQPARQQTLRNAIAWSYDLLSPAEQTLFRRLSVFVGSFGLDAAERVMGDGATPGDGAWVMGHGTTAQPSSIPHSRTSSAITHDPSPITLDGVAALVDKGLLHVAEETAADEEAEPRFRMLETIREFATERFLTTDEVEPIRAAHAAHVQAKAEEAEGIYLRGEDVPWLAVLAAEQGNIRAALAWAIEQEEAEHALRIAAAVHWFWFARGQFGEGREWLRRTLAPEWSRAHRTAARSKALFAAGMLAHYQGDAVQARALLAECEPLSREVGDHTSLARSLLLRGVVAEDAGEYAGARSLIEEALALFRQLDDQLWASQSLVHLGVVAFGLNDLDAATRFGREGIEAYRAVGAKLGAAIGIAGALDLLALVACARGEDAEAIELQRRSLTMRVEIENGLGIAASLAGFATIAARTNQAETAARLFGAAEVLREEIGAALAHPERDAYERAIASLRTQLPAERFAESWRQGRALPADEAIAEALAVTPRHGKAPETGQTLTARELEILRLLAGGASDKEIGEQLFISHRTVMRHVANIYGKLDIGSRSAATAYAHRNGLV